MYCMYKCVHYLLKVTYYMSPKILKFPLNQYKKLVRIFSRTTYLNVQRIFIGSNVLTQTITAFLYIYL